MNSFDKDTPPPGLFIKEELEARGWAQRDLAYILGITEQAVTRLLTGKYGISPEMAKALGEAFDVSPELFINLQRAYDLAHAREPDPGVARRGRLQSVYPVREMISRGWLENAEPATLEVQMKAFLRAANSNDVLQINHAAKKTNAGEPPTPAQLAWLYRVMQIAEAVVCKPYSERGLKEAIPRLKQLMAHPEAVRDIPRILAECGVRFVIVEGLASSKIDGVCFWLDADRPVIGMSLRHDRIDNFWFVLMHEIAHVLHRHGKDEPIIDVELEGDRATDSVTNLAHENVANRSAADYCITEHEMITFVARKSPFFSERDIVGFAIRMGVHPGIVVGQIHNRTKRYPLLRKYLVKVREYLLPGAMVDGWGQVAPVSL
jgi:HTH-type transcriptional regulator/antitoxin HigA